MPSPAPPQARAQRRALRSVLGALVVASSAGAVALASPAAAATLTEVTTFGANPTNLRMHLYVPDTVATRPAVLVAVHYRAGSGPAFYSGTEFATLANQYGFMAIYPSATCSGQCLDVSSPGALPGASTTIGFQATHTGDSGRPASFTLNGAMCTVA